MQFKTALIVGAGPGISAAVARLLVAAGLKVGLAARNIDKLATLSDEIGAERFATDAADPGSVQRLFEEVDAGLGSPEVVIYNASGRLRGPVAELDPEAVRSAVNVSAFGAFLTVQQAARRMLPQKRGAILLTGATAGVKGFAGSAAFAMGKFALRGLAQSAARELGPKGIHVAHIIVDGGVRSERRPNPADRPDSTLTPDASPRLTWPFSASPAMLGPSNST
ncbi:SDR family NAD(P)-dependent oxidoreductase [Micromonospora sp. STR1s_5]|nr:SDR family NAD(P)-dependent oxidoreductase [Micromonospora sp. STR1s_5]